MPTENKTVDSILQLITEIKEYVILQKDYAKLELVEKLTILISTLIMVLVITLLGIVTLFYVLFALVYVLEPLVGGLPTSLSIIAVISLLIMAFLAIFRKKIIINPLTKFLVKLFLQDSNK